jgi:hypothetical protein
VSIRILCGANLKAGLVNVQKEKRAIDTNFLLSLLRIGPLKERNLLELPTKCESLQNRNSKLKMNEKIYNTFTFIL